MVYHREIQETSGEMFAGFPIEVFETFEQSMYHVLIPVFIFVGAQFIKNMYDPVQKAQMISVVESAYIVRFYHGFMGNGIYGAGKVGEDIIAGMNTFELGYTIAYFSMIWGGLSSLMVYNLLAMFGLDKTISEFSRALT